MCMRRILIALFVLLTITLVALLLGMVSLVRAEEPEFSNAYACIRGNETLVIWTQNFEGNITIVADGKVYQTYHLDDSIAPLPTSFQALLREMRPQTIELRGDSQNQFLLIYRDYFLPIVNK